MGRPRCPPSGPRCGGQPAQGILLIKIRNSSYRPDYLLSNPHNYIAADLKPQFYHCESYSHGFQAELYSWKFCHNHCIGVEERSDVFSCAFVINFLTVRPLHIVHSYLVSDIHLKTKWVQTSSGEGMLLISRGMSTLSRSSLPASTALVITLLCYSSGSWWSFGSGVASSLSSIAASSSASYLDHKKFAEVS